MNTIARVISSRLLISLGYLSCVATTFAFYNPATGRWLTRDPIEEHGGDNLYSFLHNAPIGNVDVLGKQLLPIVCKPLCDKAGNIWRRLNDAEKAWAKKHPACAANAFKEGVPDSVTDALIKRYGSIPAASVMNAILHCTWTCFMFSLPCCSKEAALDGVKAHETPGPNNGNTPHDIAMDLHNNNVGAGIGGKNLEDCLGKCHTAAVSFQLYWFAPVEGVSSEQMQSLGLPTTFPAFQINGEGNVINGEVGGSGGRPPVFERGTQ